MASIIGVETLQHTNGTTAATINSNGLITPAAGGIVQVQYTQVTATSQISITQQTDTKITALAVNITPTSTDSIIKIEAMVNGEWGATGPSHGSTWFFYRDNTKLSAPTAGNRNVGVLMGTALSYYTTDNDSTPEHANYMYFDSPSTTSQITYTVGVNQHEATTNWNLNRTVGDSNSHGYERGVSLICVTEIAG
jgi:hypothetical protein